MHFDIVIVGAGLAGLSLAAALAPAPLRLALVEREPAAAADARAYAFNAASQRFLEAIGIWGRLPPARLSPVDEIVVHGDAGGRLVFSARACGLGELAWIVEAGLVQHELWETVRRQANLTLLCPARPQRLEMGGERVRLELAGGPALTARLVVGADGADSWVRSQAGLHADVLLYGESGVVANFACQRPHRQTAYQWFRRDGVLAWLPLPEQRISIVWSTPHAHARELLTLAPEALGRRVAEAGGHRLGALQPLTPAAAFPLRLMRVPRICAPRLALVGDAAHALHPLSGHGINLGLADARVLAAVLLAPSAGPDCGDERLLRRYARARAEEVALLQWTTHGLQRLFRPRHPALAMLRNLGLNLTDHLPVLRNMLVRYALG